MSAILLGSAGWFLAAVLFSVCLYLRKKHGCSAPESEDSEISSQHAVPALSSSDSIQEGDAESLSIFTSIPIGYFRTTVEGKIIEINPAFFHILGYVSFQELIAATGGRSQRLYNDPEERSALVSSLLSSLGAGCFTVHFLKKDGTVIPCALTVSLIRGDSGEPRYLEGVMEDISDRLRMQEAVIRTEKMATVAGLAAGMAHEINNPLGIIMQMAENAERRLLSDLPANVSAAEESGLTLECIGRYVRERKIDQYLAAIREAGERAAGIVASMVQFSRQGEEGMTALDLNAVLDSAVELAAKDYAMKKKYDFKRIAVVRSYGPVVHIKGVESHIQQVFLNILRNAAQALAASEKPVITLTTSMEGDFACVSLSDNGTGMEESVKERIFEPFFTTRPAGEGAGLGLTVVYYILVNNHKGRINVSSEPGKGSCFSLCFPADGAGSEK